MAVMRLARDSRPNRINAWFALLHLLSLPANALLDVLDGARRLLHRADLEDSKDEDAASLARDEAGEEKGERDAESDDHVIKASGTGEAATSTTTTATGEAPEAPSTTATCAVADPITLTNTNTNIDADTLNRLPLQPHSPPHTSPRRSSTDQTLTSNLSVAPSTTHPIPAAPSPPASTMAEKELSSLLKQLHQSLASHTYTSTSSLLSRAKLALLSLNALIPSPTTSKHTLLLARETLELGALISIRLQDPSSFTRYVQQLQPFYEQPASSLPREGSQQSKVTGLYLLLLLSQGDYAGFHTVLESLEVGEGREGGEVEGDAFIQYPVKLERWLMEGSYDRVWNATKSEQAPSEEYDVFSDVLVGTIRAEIASCSEKAYPSLPISNAKNLFFFDSEGSVIEFAQSRDWIVRDGRIYFPATTGGATGTGSEKEILVASGTVIENAIGYARELETIV
ncbi:MAG: hypothetical protein M1819_000555 [Sarea resinae]|nr:MAG: hypothetical protein M1819_000555 [Sarea resinae]